MQRKMLCLIIATIVSFANAQEVVESDKPNHESNQLKEQTVEQIKEIEKNSEERKAISQDVDTKVAIVEVEKISESTAKPESNPKKADEIDRVRSLQSISKEKDIPDQKITSNIESTDDKPAIVEKPAVKKDDENVKVDNIEEALQLVDDKSKQDKKDADHIEKNDSNRKSESVNTDKNQADLDSSIPNSSDLGIVYPDFDEKLINSKLGEYDSVGKFEAFDKKEIIYFDREGKNITKEDPNGYYREVLGKTADGLIVAQDFYQETKTAQTAAFILKKGGNINSFDTSENMGLIAWYDRKGEFKNAIVLDENSNPLTMHAHYRDGKLIFQADEKSSVFYYDDGKTILAYLGEDPDSKKFTLNVYRIDGQVYAQLPLKNGEIVQSEVVFWNQSGEKTDPDDKMIKSIQQLMEKIFKIIEEVDQPI